MYLNGQYIQDHDKPLLIKYAEDQQIRKEKQHNVPSDFNRYRADPYMYPMNQIPSDQKLLKGFLWLDQRRPKTKIEIFE